MAVYVDTGTAAGSLSRARFASFKSMFQNPPNPNISAIFPTSNLLRVIKPPKPRFAELVLRFQTQFVLVRQLFISHSKAGGFKRLCFALAPCPLLEYAIID